MAIPGILSKKCIGLLLLSVVLSVCLRVPYFQHSFIFVDEAWWANGGKLLVQGGHLYRDLFLDKNPPIFLFCALLFKHMGINTIALHMGSLLLVLIVSALLFRIGSRFFSPEAGGMAAVIYALASTMYYTPRIMGLNTEIIMVTFTTAAIYFYAEGLVGGRVHCFFMAGLLSSFAVITKPVAITEAALFFLFLMFSPNCTKSMRIRSLILLTDGFLNGLFVLLAYLTYSGARVAWWEQCILYPFRYVGLIDLSGFLFKLIFALSSFVLIYVWLWILIGQSRIRNPIQKIPYRIAICWIGSALVGVIIGRRFYANYFIQVMPPMALVGAIGCARLWNNRHEQWARNLAHAACVAFFIPFVWFHCQTLMHWYYLVAPLAHSKVQFWGICREDRNTREIAEYLKSTTKRGDRLFVWGSKAQLYFLADREVAGAYLDFDVADDFPPKASEKSVRHATVEKLRRGLPRYIIDVQRNARLDNFPSFRKLVEDCYQLEIQIHDARLYRLRDASAIQASLLPVQPKT